MSNNHIKIAMLFRYDPVSNEYFYHLKAKWILTVSGFVIGTEVEPGIHERAGRLMQNLSIYQKPIKAYSLKTSDKKGPQSSRNKRTQER